MHPLSYLIKPTNFNALKEFKENYFLIDSLIISSEIFTPNSSTFFPIIIVLYEKNRARMSYEFIKNFKFKTLENHKFRLNDFNFITNYVGKYLTQMIKEKKLQLSHLNRYKRLKKEPNFSNKKRTQTQ